MSSQVGQARPIAVGHQTRRQQALALTMGGMSSPACVLQVKAQELVLSWHMACLSPSCVAATHSKNCAPCEYGGKGCLPFLFALLSSVSPPITHPPLPRMPMSQPLMTMPTPTVKARGLRRS